MSDAQEQQEQIDVMFYQLILSIQASVMQHLGKVVSPLTGKIDRNLEAARYSIDMLEMIGRKTAGNLAEEEKQLVEHVLYELRLNYIEEVNKGGESENPPDESSESGGETIH